MSKVLWNKGCSAAAQPAAALPLTKMASGAVMTAIREEEGERERTGCERKTRWR